MLAKSAVDLIGTSGAKQAFSAAQAISSANRDISGKLGLMIHIAVAYGASLPTTQPELRVYTSPDNSSFDSWAYESTLVPTTKEDGTSAASSTVMLALPVRFAEDVKYYNVKLINGATNGVSAWVAAVEVSP